MTDDLTTPRQAPDGMTTRRALLAGTAAAAAATLAAPASAQGAPGTIPQPLLGKVALVTGGERGIGRAIALELARQGADVAIAGVPGELPHVHYPQGTPEDLASTVAEIEAMGRRAHGMRLDVRDEAQVERVVAQTVGVLGGLDVAVNNAAVNTPATPLAEFDTGAYDVIMDVNLRGAWLSMKHEIPAMLTRGGGSIVNIGSDQSTIAGQNISAYVASKHGLVGATRGAAMDYGARGIRVNLVAPGPTDTAQFRSFVREPEAREAFVRAQVPMQKLGRPEDYGGLVAWLASDAAAFANGGVYEVDGGFSAAM